MSKILRFDDFKKYINEVILDSSEISEARKVEIKRKYTEKYPSIKASVYGPVRASVLKFIANHGVVTKDELLEFLQRMNEETGRRTTMQWVRRNERYIKEFQKDDITMYRLTRLGEKLIQRLSLYESLNDDDE